VPKAYKPYVGMQGAVDISSILRALVVIFLILVLCSCTTMGRHGSAIDAKQSAVDDSVPLSSPTQTIDAGQEATFNSWYDLYAKHKLHLGDYKVPPSGVVRPPNACYWEAYKTLDPKGYVYLHLYQKHSELSGFSFVRSYLTPQEALKLSEQLRDAASERFESAVNLVGATAPQLAVEAWLNCEPTNLASLRDKVVVLAFWGYEATPIAWEMEQAAVQTHIEATTVDPSIAIQRTVEGWLPSIELEEVPLSEFLQTALRAVGLSYEVRAGFVWISTPDVLAQQPSVPPEVLAKLPHREDESPARLAEEVKSKLESPVTVDFAGGASIRELLDIVSDAYGLTLVLDERVMLPPGVQPVVTDGTLLLVRLLNELHDKYSESRVEVIIVHGVTANRAFLESLVEEMPIKCRLAVDKRASETPYKGATGTKYGLTDHTVILVIDRDGKIRYQDIGLPEVEEAVERLLDEQ